MTALAIDETSKHRPAAIAAQLLGVADTVFGITLGYLKERRQLDRAIGEFQALQHRAAELYIDIELTRALVLGALQELLGDAGFHADRVAAMNGY